MRHYNLKTNNGMYKHGKTCKDRKYYCIDCKKQITASSAVYGEGRCKSCSFKLRKHTKEENEHNRLMHLGKKLSKLHRLHIKQAAKRIKNYGMKEKNHTEKSRIQMSVSHGGNGDIFHKHIYSYEFLKIRKEINKRDKHRCQICNKNGKDVHHIDYNKKNNSQNNLITLCHSCHTRTNGNRDYWYSYFRSKI